MRKRVIFYDMNLLSDHTYPFSEDFVNDSPSLNSPETKQTLYFLIHSTLTERQKQILLLYYYKGLTLDQIGEQLGISRSTVCRTKQRGCYRLKRYLDTMYTLQKADLRCKERN